MAASIFNSRLMVFMTFHQVNTAKTLQHCSPYSNYQLLLIVSYMLKQYELSTAWKVFGLTLNEPQYSQTSHSQKFTGLPHNVAELYTYISFTEIHKRKWFTPVLLLKSTYSMSCSQKFTERRWFSSHCCWMVPRVFVWSWRASATFLSYVDRELLIGVNKVNSFF